MFHLRIKDYIKYAYYIKIYTCYQRSLMEIEYIYHTPWCVTCVHSFPPFTQCLQSREKNTCLYVQSTALLVFCELSLF